MDGTVISTSIIGASAIIVAAIIKFVPRRAPVSCNRSNDLTRELSRVKSDMASKIAAIEKDQAVDRTTLKSFSHSFDELRKDVRGLRDKMDEIGVLLLAIKSKD